MKQIQPDLWQTDWESPIPGLTTHAYLLTRGDGNVLFYNTSYRHELEHMAALGGVAYQFLSHRDELGDSICVIHERFGAQLGGHMLEKEEFSRTRAPDILFQERETLLGNIDIIPVPGHSPGSTCFAVQSPHGKCYLFTGDTLFRNSDGVWTAGFIPGYTAEEERTTLAESLTLLRQLRPDVVLSSAFGDAGYEEMAPADWPGHVDRALTTLLAGGE